MSYHDLPDPRPVSVKYALGPLPRGIAIMLMLVLIGGCIAGVVGLCLDRQHLIAWGAGSLLAGLLAAQYFMAIRWVDFNKSWPRRRTYRKHRATHQKV